MKFDAKSGALELCPKASLRRHMQRRDLHRMSLQWEDWIVPQNGEPVSYRAVIPAEYKGHFVKVILIADFKPGDGPIAQWSIGPKGGDWSYQNRPEGKFTKKMRKWFFELTGVKVPQGGDWGDIDAEYDPHNLLAEVLCIYREKFDSDELWKEYRKKYKF